MIRITPGQLPANVAKWLTRWGQELSAITDYANRVTKAREDWSKRRSNTKTMKAVEDSLVEACSGVRRCNYCEDSAAHEIEHVDPKSFYPEKTFSWDNMLFACGWCNGPKNNKHAIFDAATGQFTEVVRDEHTGVVPPPIGLSVLINPRTEDPADYFHLDLLGTFVICVRGGLAPSKQRRAEYTNEILRLQRDELIATRRAAYQSFVALLDRYIRRRDSGACAEELGRIIDAVKHHGHRYVWLEMIRQHTKIVELNDLFCAAPEALDW